MDIAGHVSRQMVARYSHIRMEAKRKALEAIKTTAVPALATEQTLPAEQDTALKNLDKSE